MNYNKLLTPILGFLQCETPDEWVAEASKPDNLKTILLDHLFCELKAGQSAMFLIRKYAVDKESARALLAWLRPFEDFAYRKQGDGRELVNQNTLSKSMFPKTGAPYSKELIDKMVILIKEELHHFCQVLEILNEYDIAFENISSSRYAAGLLKHVTNHEPHTLIDKLICGAYIEARSCERFAKLAPNMDTRVGNFYLSLLRSEARHYQDYLALAEQIAEQIAGFDIAERIAFFGEIEANLILSPDTDFKFHSGLFVPQQSQASHNTYALDC
ncbi:MAG: tRNA isopentenyl-2-thiomethyl-A-37 hydroxylase MiaE [Pseudomonadota bacterium]